MPSNQNLLVPLKFRLWLPASLIVAAFWAMFGWVLAAEIEVLESTEVDPAALNFSSSASNFSQNVNGRTYQRSPVSTLKGYQYATYYDANRNVCLARRKLPSGSWDVIRFTDYQITNNDSHNVVALGICAGDGTIHLSFDHHGDTLHYRVSAVGVATNPESVTWSTSLFSSITDSLGSVGKITGLTYPSFFPAPNGNLMFYYRSGGSGSGDGMIHEYNGSTSQWSSGMGKFIARTGTYNGALSTNSTSRNPYINGISYGGNRLHASWGWRESAGGAQFNHDLNYAYSDDDGRTWRNSAGSQIGTTDSSFISINSPGLIVAPIPQDIGLSNQYTHYAYPDGSCHVLVQHQQSGTSNNRYHHYWRNAAGNWSSEVLPLSGSRPKLVGDDNRELFLAYVSGGTLRVAKGSPNAAQTSWSWSTIHNESGRSEGGEGHIDVTRWEADRVLSLYGQVDGPSNGNPTALNVFDYHVSAKAILPIPSDETMDVAVSSNLEWTGGIDADTHRVYLGTSRAAVEGASTSSPEFQGEQAASTFTPAGPLAKNTTYYWRVDEVQSGSLVTPGLIWSFTTSPDFLAGVSADASVKEDLGVVDASSDATLLGAGGSSPWVDRCTVYVFQLPDLGADAQPFLSASFRCNYESKDGSLRDNDLYGLGRRSSPDVLGSDYYGQTAVDDPSDATRLQTDILTNATPLGAVRTSIEGDEALLAYLNAQYDSGAGIGDYVFLRLNTAAPKAGINRASVSMAESGVDANLRPRIAYSTNAGPSITMVALGNPENLSDASTWSDGLPAHPGAHYVVPATGNLRSESGTSIFPGNSLTVQAGGKFQVRSVEGDVTTVDNLTLEGGSGFTSGQFAELAAGTGSGVTNVIDGMITQSGATRLVTYGGSIARKLKILSPIEGDGTLQVTGEGAIIDNGDNSFSGIWDVADDSELVFEVAGAVGTADISVQSGGTLEIKGSWDQNATLTVANVSGTEVKVGSNEWTLSSLILGGVSVEDGIYLPSDLSGLGNVLFSGTGRVTVGTPIFTQEVVAGWDLWSSNTAPVANVTGSGITATATASTATGSWNTADDSSSGRGSSGDTTWGSFDGNGRSASAVTTGMGSNMTAANGVSTAELTLTITNNGEADWDLDSFHMDVVAFRANAPRAYQLEVISGDITNGVVFTSTDDEINELGGNLSGNNDDHDEIDLSLIGLADSTLEAGETAVIRISFSSGTGSGGGHHLFLDNVAVSGVLKPDSEIQLWRYEYFGTIENTGAAADNFDANSDGEDNLLEFATGQNPHAATLAQTGLEMNGGDLEFRYTRSKAALADGFIFQVEWSDTLLAGSWSSSGVVDALDTENPGDSAVENRIAIVPIGTGSRRFVRLAIAKP